MTRDTLLNAATVVVLACTVVATGTVVTNSLRFRQTPAARSFGDRTGKTVGDWKSFAEHGQWLGPQAAEVVVVEFGDYQCPACAHLDPALRAVQQAHAAQVAILYRHFPLARIHPYAVEAANAAECAGAQGRFAAMHSLLFQLQDSLSTTPWPTIAARAGVRQLDDFTDCLRSARYQAQVTEDTADGRRLAVAGTPTLLINGTLIEGAPDSAALDAYVNRALATRAIR